MSVGFFLASGATPMPIVIFQEVLKAANRLSGQPLLDIAMYSLDGEPFSAVHGTSFPVAGRIEKAPRHDAIAMMVGYPPAAEDGERIARAVRAQMRNGAEVWAVDGAIVLLAACGMIAGRRVALHWEVQPHVRERWPDLEATTELFCEDGPFLTCGGGTACLDMMLHVVGRRFGTVLARAIADEYLYTLPRPPDSPQRLEDARHEPVLLARAIGIMETHVEAPLSIGEIAARAGVSVRQLEHLARRHLQQTPIQHYRLIRLKRARELLLHSQLSITEVAVACGFSAISSFSRTFSQTLGVPPRAYRERYRRELARPYVRL